MTKIYLLYHNDSDKVYIGKTIQQLHRRLSGHMSDKANNKRTCWIKSLKNKKEAPSIDIIEEVEDSIASEREIYWIAEYKIKYGVDRVLNMSEGGDGGSIKGIKKSEETKKRMSLAAMGNTNGLGIKRDLSVGRKISESKKGKSCSEQHIRNLTRSKRNLSKLNEVLVAEIRAKYIPHKYDSIKLGLEYGINSRTIRKIVNNKIWKIQGENL